MAEYAEIRHLLNPGDLVLFGGRGPVSAVIKWGTKSPASHAGIISHVDVAGSSPGTRVHVVEATSLNGHASVFSTPLSHRVRDYKGEVWILTLSEEARSRLTPLLPEAWAWIDEHVEKATAYDTWGAVRCEYWPQKDNYSKLFCSETVAGFWKEGTVIPDESNASAWSPRDCGDARLFGSTYYQVSGRPKDLPNYNTIAPEAIK